MIRKWKPTDVDNTIYLLVRWSVSFCELFLNLLKMFLLSLSECTFKIRFKATDSWPTNNLCSIYKGNWCAIVKKIYLRIFYVCIRLITFFIYWIEFIHSLCEFHFILCRSNNMLTIDQHFISAGHVAIFGQCGDSRLSLRHMLCDCSFPEEGFSSCCRSISACCFHTYILN